MNIAKNLIKKINPVRVIKEMKEKKARKELLKKERKLKAKEVFEDKVFEDWEDEVKEMKGKKKKEVVHEEEVIGEEIEVHDNFFGFNNRDYNEIMKLSYIEYRIFFLTKLQNNEVLLEDMVFSDPKDSEVVCFDLRRR
ncbi:4360_t:CDS:2 [Diversispora eburnea]|uniref:4360_t:CDS:1 n=1 Tax=Diversispora eburnea TaxID=1213867 RepID=A0A9N9F2G1_9GLOM|nr:4360_t:CDS:2 [Diversispora eburnea]